MSEFDLIRQLTAQAPTARPDVVIGPGDDAAVLAVPAGHELVLTTDTLVAGRHFHVDAAAADVGWKALAANLSDLAAMGADAAWITVALTVPDDDADWLAGFVAGLAELLLSSGAVLVGGDLTRGPLAVTIQAAGTLPAGTALRRDGARPGDVVAVTGTLGDVGLALARGAQAGGGSHDRALQRRLNRPEPRLAAGRALRGHAHAAADVSDGLLSDLGHIVAASGVGARVEAARLPCSPSFDALCPAADRLRHQLAAGDDYELCVCGPADTLAQVPWLTVIGRVETAPGVCVVNARGQPVAAGPAGYDHFAD